MDFMAVMSGISTAADLYKSAVQLRDEAKITAATQDLNTKLIVAGSFCLQMQEKMALATDSESALKARVRELEEAVRQLEQKVSERERYELIEPYGGTLTYRLKEACANGEPIHDICPACMDNRSVKSILQFESPKKIFGKCPECSRKYQCAEALRMRL